MQIDRPDGRDQQLLAAFATLGQGDLAALEQLWDLVAEQLYALALWRSGSRQDAEDAVQDVFVRLACNPAAASRVRWPRAYLLAMAHRATVDRMRRRRTDPLEEAFLVPSDEGPPTFEGRRLNEALAALPAPQREVVYLRHWADLSFKEIAAVTGVPTFTAASRYRLAVQRLRSSLGV
ncbi:MAG: sigma-70 family RNA polymerase sigma factor [Acidobacteriota bacterium]